MLRDGGAFRTRLRAKGQVTVPTEVRVALDVNEGDDLVFVIDEHGRVCVQRVQTIPPDQAWFWTERWQRMEREAQADIDAGRVERFPDIETTLDYLDSEGGNE
jgi:antitoxin MazE